MKIYQGVLFNLKNETHILAYFFEDDEGNTTSWYNGMNGLNPDTRNAPIDPDFVEKV